MRPPLCPRAQAMSSITSAEIHPYPAHTHPTLLYAVGAQLHVACNVALAFRTASPSSPLLAASAVSGHRYVLQRRGCFLILLGHRGLAGGGCRWGTVPGTTDTACTAGHAAATVLLGASVRAGNGGQDHLLVRVRHIGGASEHWEPALRQDGLWSLRRRTEGIGHRCAGQRRALTVPRRP